MTSLVTIGVYIEMFIKQFPRWGKIDRESIVGLFVLAGVNVSECVGLLTADADFRFCYDVKGFDIVMPRRLIRRMRNKKPITYSIY